jgi:large subunit ribosomal protein L2
VFWEVYPCPCFVWRVYTVSVLESLIIVAIKVYKKNRAARRQASVVDRSAVSRRRPYKTLTAPRQRLSGRGSQGKITVRHRGGGAKRRLRLVDFGQSKLGITGRIERIEYDPNRSAYLALVVYQDGERQYVLAWEGAEVGDQIVANKKTPEKDGNRLQLQHVTPGLTVYNVELQPNRGGRLFRSAGAFGVVMDIQGYYAQLKMPSGEIRLIPKLSYATVGKVSNADWRLVRYGSAGRKRRMGRRPAVRGKAMNPVDHPHGGGEGLQGIGMKRPKTKWGKPALGVRTRRPGKYSDRFILARRKTKKRK